MGKITERQCAVSEVRKTQVKILENTSGEGKVTDNHVKCPLRSTEIGLEKSLMDVASGRSTVM